MIRSLLCSLRGITDIGIWFDFNLQGRLIGDVAQRFTQRNIIQRHSDARPSRARCGRDNWHAGRAAIAGRGSGAPPAAGAPAAGACSGTATAPGIGDRYHLAAAGGWH